MVLGFDDVYENRRFGESGDIERGIKNCTHKKMMCGTEGWTIEIPESVNGEIRYLCSQCGVDVTDEVMK